MKSRASFFFAIDAAQRAIITRPLGHEILPSITRAMVMQVAERAGLTTIERTLTPEQAVACDELFIAVTTKDIIPISQFNRKPVGSGGCGALTSDLIGAFKDFVKEKIA